jgi:hypothetical protein
VEPIGLERRYWARLDAPFRTFFIALPSDRVVNEDGETLYGRRSALREWAAVVHQAAQSALVDGLKAIGATGRGLRAVTIAQDEFEWRLNIRLKRARQDWGLAEEARTGGER